MPGDSRLAGKQLFHARSYLLLTFRQDNPVIISHTFLTCHTLTFM